MKAFCISHVKDVDGLGAAAIVVAATGARFALSDYSTLMEDLARVPEKVDRFVLCDLGSDNSNAGEFVERMASLAARAKVTYIDHHLMSAETGRRLADAGVELVHDERECASMLAYRAFAGEAPPGARLIALMGAVTDYMDNSPMAAAMMEKEDRQFVLLESTMLAYALAKKGALAGYPESVVRKLAAMKRPHEIPGVPRAAAEQLAVAVRLTREVGRTGRRMGRLAYAFTEQHSTGIVAKLLIGSFDVPVGVAMKEKDPGWCEVSVRGTTDCKVHLGKAMSKISGALGGNGGGHRKAAGCRVPRAAVPTMLERLARTV